MRKIIFCLLLAGAAAPALAAGRPNHNNDDPPQRQQAHVEHPARAEQTQRPANGPRPQYNGPQGHGDFQRPQFSGSQGRPDFQRPQFNAEGQHGRPPINGNAYAQGAPNGGRDWQRSQRDDSWQQQQQQQQRGQAVNGYNRDQQQRYRGAYGGRDGSAGNWSRQGRPAPFRAEGSRSGHVQWNTGWRNDRRYDWRERRSHNRSLFHLGLYIDPFGWGYQPYSIGYDLQPGYYQQNYWIDPAMYGLPYPPSGTQWVRYWNDAVLVDMYSGEIVDSIQGFFW